jgi:YD repeat-containing protein
MMRRLLFALCLFAALLAATLRASTTYTYDALSRLVKVVYADGTTVVYTYDAAGNRVGETVSTSGGAGNFTDGTLVPGGSPIRAVHVTELRARIDTVRKRYGLTAFDYTTDTIVPRTTMVSAVDLSELRTALVQAYAAAGLALPADIASPAQGQVIRALDINMLRTALFAIE